MPKKTEIEIENPNLEETVFEEVSEIVVEVPNYKHGEFIQEATITTIKMYPHAEDLFKEKTVPNQIGKPVYLVVFEVIGDIPKGLSNEGNAVISKTTGRSKNSGLYKYNSRYGNYPKVGDIVKVENDVNGFWQLIL